MKKRKKEQFNPRFNLGRVLEKGKFKEKGRRELEKSV